MSLIIRKSDTIISTTWLVRPRHQFVDLDSMLDQLLKVMQHTGMHGILTTDALTPIDAGIDILDICCKLVSWRVQSAMDYISIEGEFEIGGPKAHLLQHAINTSLDVTVSPHHRYSTDALIQSVDHIVFHIPQLQGHQS